MQRSFFSTEESWQLFIADPLVDSSRMYLQTGFSVLEMIQAPFDSQMIRDILMLKSLRNFLLKSCIASLGGAEDAP